jgi:hypothetical protein
MRGEVLSASIRTAKRGVRGSAGMSNDSANAGKEPLHVAGSVKLRTTPVSGPSQLRALSQLQLDLI